MSILRMRGHEHAPLGQLIQIFACGVGLPT